MANFIPQYGIISKADSVVSGGLSISQSIVGSYDITASFVYTSSYAINSGIGTYLIGNSAETASYSITAKSASVANTSSTLTGLRYGPTPGIGIISPNYNVGAGIVTQFGILTAAAGPSGILYTPFTVNKTCTVTTMSIAGGSTALTTVRFGVYSHSTSSMLPQYLLASGSTTFNNVGPTYIDSIPNDTVTLEAGNIYWAAFSGATTFKWIYPLNNYWIQNYNPILQVISSATTGSRLYPPSYIRSGSTYGLTLPGTASQLPTQYNYSSPLAASTTTTDSVFIVLLPVLKIKYS